MAKSAIFFLALALFNASAVVSKYFLSFYYIIFNLAVVTVKAHRSLLMLTSYHLPFLDVLEIDD